MATIQMLADVNVKSYYYDPDGPNSPLTLQFPDTTTIPNGSRIRVVNKTVSRTPVTLAAVGADLIADPEGTPDLGATQLVSAPGLLLQYQSAGNEWRVVGHGDPDLAKHVKEVFSFASYGGLKLSTSSGVPNIASAWRTISEFDQTAFSADRGIPQNVANSSLSFQYAGVYSSSILLSYTHDEQNGSRETQLRLFNLTDNVPTVYNPIVVPIARNQSGSLISVTTLFEVTETSKNKEFILQIGNGDTLSSVVARVSTWDVFAVSEWRGEL